MADNLSALNKYVFLGSQRNEPAPSTPMTTTRSRVGSVPSAVWGAITLTRRRHLHSARSWFEPAHLRRFPKALKGCRHQKICNVPLHLYKAMVQGTRFADPAHAASKGAIVRAFLPFEDLMNGLEGDFAWGTRERVSAARTRGSHNQARLRKGRENLCHHGGWEPALMSNVSRRQARFPAVPHLCQSAQRANRSLCLLSIHVWGFVLSVRGLGLQSLNR